MKLPTVVKKAIQSVFDDDLGYGIKQGAKEAASTAEQSAPKVYSVPDDVFAEFTPTPNALDTAAANIIEVDGALTQESLDKLLKEHDGLLVGPNGEIAKFPTNEEDLEAFADWRSFYPGAPLQMLDYINQLTGVTTRSPMLGTGSNLPPSMDAIRPLFEDEIKSVTEGGQLTLREGARERVGNTLREAGEVPYGSEYVNRADRVMQLLRDNQLVTDRDLLGLDWNRLAELSGLDMTPSGIAARAAEQGYDPDMFFRGVRTSPGGDGLADMHQSSIELGERRPLDQWSADNPAVAHTYVQRPTMSAGLGDFSGQDYIPPYSEFRGSGISPDTGSVGKIIPLLTQPASTRVDARGAPWNSLAGTPYVTDGVPRIDETGAFSATDHFVHRDRQLMGENAYGAQFNNVVDVGGVPGPVGDTSRFAPGTVRATPLEYTRAAYGLFHPKFQRLRTLLGAAVPAAYGIGVSSEEQ